MTKSKSAALPVNKISIVGDIVPVGDDFDMGVLPFRMDAPPAKELAAPSRTAGQVLADTGAQLAEGVNNIFGAIPSLVAPEGEVAGFFRGNAEHWRGKQSDILKGKIAKADQAISAAGDDGVLAQMAEAAGQYFSDPALAARFVTTNLPSMLPGIGAAKLAQMAALARGASAVGAAAAATTAGGAANAALNAGGARGEAFQDIQRTLLEQGMDAQTAEAMALQDSRVVAAVGGVAGFLSGKTGLEKSLFGKAAGKSAAQAGVAAALTELGGEQLEEVAPKVATNAQAGQYDGRGLDKDVGRTMVETAIGSAPGAVLAGAATAVGFQPAAADPLVAVRRSAEQPDSPLSRAAMAAQPAQNSSPALATPASAAINNVADPISERVAKIENFVRSTGMLDQLRAEGPEAAKNFLATLGIARTPSEDTGARLQALDALEQSLRSQSATEAGAQWQQMAGSTPAEDMATQKAQAEGANAAGQQFQTLGLTTPAEDLQAQRDQHTADVAQQAGVEWQRVSANMPESGEMRGIPNRPSTAQEKPQNSSPALATPASAAINNVAHAAPEFVAPELRQVPLKRYAAPQGPGTAQMRMAKETMNQAVAAGFDAVERQVDGSFRLVNHGGREYAVVTPGEAQMAAASIRTRFDAMAHGSATSPLNDLAQPTDGQKSAGNYQKGHGTRFGLPVAIENPTGSVRSGVSPDGKAWSTTMQSHYGYFKKTEGADGDQVDAFFGNTGPRNFVIDQVDPKTGAFDEHKVMVGFRDADEARAAYLSNYEPGWKGLGAIHEKSAPALRAWLQGDTTQPLDNAIPMPAPKVEPLTPVQQRIEEDAAAVAALGSHQALQDSSMRMAEDSPDAQALRALLKVLEEAFGVRGVAVQTDHPNQADGYYMGGDRFFINIRDPHMHLAHSIGHEFAHSQEAAFSTLRERLWDMVSEEGKREYWSGRPELRDHDYAHATDKQLAMLKSEMLADFFGGRFRDRAWLEQLARQKPALFGEFVAAWVKALEFIGAQLKHLMGSADFASSYKNIDRFLSDVQEAHAIAMEVAAEWAQRNPRLADKHGVQLSHREADMAFAGIEIVEDLDFTKFLDAKSHADIQAELQAELEEIRQRQDASEKRQQDRKAKRSLKVEVSDNDIQQAGVMAEEAYDDLYFDERDGYILEARVPDLFTVGKSAVIQLEEREGGLWGASLRGTWIGPAASEPEGYATLDGAKAFAKRFVAAYDLAARGFDLKAAIGKPEAASLLQAWNAINMADGHVRRARTVGRKAGSMGMADIAKAMGLDVLHDIKVTESSDEGDEINVISVAFISKKSGNRASADLWVTEKDGRPVATAHTTELGRSGLGSAVYQLFAEYAAGRGITIHPDSSLSGINTYRRTEQMLSAALRTGKSNVMVPHPTQRIYGFNDSAKTKAEHNDNIVRMLLAGLRNARELVPNLDDLQYRPSTGTFTDVYGMDAGRKVKSILSETDVRAFGMGEATLARALMTRDALESGEMPDLAQGSAKPVLYSARDDAALELQAVREQYSGTPQWMKAPNGEPTKLSEHQWLQVRTPQFRRWFGDWEAFAGKEGGVWNDVSHSVSKVVGENGEPLVVYHGTDQGGFMAFETPGGEKRGDLGIFTTDDLGMARSYVRRGRATDVSPPTSHQDLLDLGYEFTQAEDGDWSYTGTDGYEVGGFRSEASAVRDALENWDGESGVSTVYEAFVNLRNPHDEHFEGALWDGGRDHQWIVEYGGEQQFDHDGRGYFNSQDEAGEFAKTFLSPEDIEAGVDPMDYVRGADGHYADADGVVRSGRRYGHDGAIISQVIDDGGGAGYSGDPANVYVAFHPNQVKSAEWNIGTFDDGDDLRFSARDAFTIGLSSATSSIPGLHALQQRANGGDKQAARLLNHVAYDSLSHLVGGIASARVERGDVTGLYFGEMEPSLALQVSFDAGDRASVLAALAKFADNYNQHQIHVRQPTTDAIGTQYKDGSFATIGFEVNLGRPLTRDEVQGVIDKSGLVGLSYDNQKLFAYYVGKPEDSHATKQFIGSSIAVRDAIASIGASGPSYRASVSRLWVYGRPIDGLAEPIPYSAIAGDLHPRAELDNRVALRVAEDLAGAPVQAFAHQDITEQQRALQTEIKDAYAALPLNDLGNPLVRRAYDELAKEVKEQYLALPLKSVEIFEEQDQDGNPTGEPYANSAAMRRDVLDNNHLLIYGTDTTNFGPPGVHYENHPLLADSGLKDANDTPLLMNDLFRAVHGYYAHTMSAVEFGPEGEEAAWKNHMAMTRSPWARWALTSETRGQSSWVNFRPGMMDTPVTERGVAEQKVALLPIRYAMTGRGSVDVVMRHLERHLGDQASGSLPAGWTAPKQAIVPLMEVPDVERPSYGAPRPGAITVVGYHFSRGARSTLSPSMYGTGLKGAEAARLQGPENADLRSRSFFYVDKGVGVMPEFGVGPHMHSVTLRNVYNVTDDALGLVRGTPNDWERAVMDAGFDGYVTLDPMLPQGYVVVLGKHQIPVKYHGIRDTKPGVAFKLSAREPALERTDAPEPVDPKPRGRAKASDLQRAQGVAFSARTDAYLAQRNKTLKKVDSRSVLEADIALATKALDAAVLEIQAGNYQQVSVPIGPMPHVLRMLGAPAQMMKADASIIKKVLIDKHAGDFKSVTSREFVMALYEPALVLKSQTAGEFELVSDIVTADGPIMFAIKTNVQLGSLPLRVGAVMSAYAKPVAGGGNTIGKRIADGNLLYADMGKAQAAITGQKEKSQREAGFEIRTPREDFTGGRAQFRATPSKEGTGRNVADAESLVKPLTPKFAGWAAFSQSIKDGAASRKVRTDVQLLAWIGDHYRGDWADVPSFSARDLRDNTDPKDNSFYDDLRQRISDAHDGGGVGQLYSDDELPAALSSRRQGGHVRVGDVVLRGRGRHPDSAATIQWTGAPELLGEYLTTGFAVRTKDGQAGFVMAVIPSHLVNENPSHQELFSLFMAGEHAMAVQFAPGSNDAYEVMVEGVRPGSAVAQQYRDHIAHTGILQANGQEYLQLQVGQRVTSSWMTEAARRFAIYRDGQLPDLQFERATGANPSDQRRVLSAEDVEARFSSRGSAWDAGKSTKLDDVVYKLQDKHIDTKRVIEAIQAAGAQVDEQDNPYLQEELFHGRAAKQTEDFAHMELKPLMEAIAQAGLKMDDVEEYLHARHAKEANRVIAERNPDEPGLQDGGSGMTDAAADAYMAALSPAEHAKLRAVAAKVDAIIAKSRQLYADYELESQEKVDGWAQMFQHYIPLMREQDGDEPRGMGLGQGFSVKGKEVKGRTGSKRKVVDILANIAMQRERLVVRGEKNRVAQAMLGLAAANPNADFWTVGQAPSTRVYDAETNTVVDRIDPMYKSRPNVLVAKVKQPDGAVKEIGVVFNEDDARAMRMVTSMKNLDAAQLEGLLGLSAKLTRYFAAVNTQYNPVFGVVNLVRDLQSALINLDGTSLANRKGRVSRDAISALVGIYQDMRAVRQGKTANSAWAHLWEEFQREGGQTGYRDQFRSSADRTEALQHELDPHAWADSPLGQAFTANGALRVPAEKAVDMARGLFGWLSDYNEAMENGVRLAAYKAGLDQGMSRSAAASLAKNLTVNFNRKGQITQQAGALYAFFNAAVQGSARIGQTLFTVQGGDIKTLRLSGTGKKVVYGGMLLGTMQALALAAAGFGDDDPPEFVREKNLIIPIGSKTYVSIPMPQGFHVLPGLGRMLTEYALGGFKSPAKRVVDATGMFADAFNPIGNAGWSIQTIAPTAIDPLVALTENKDFTGKPIARVSSNKAIPGFTQYKDTASTLSKLLAEAINGVTGGNAYVAGAMSPTPDQIDYLIGQATGGVGRELSKVEQVGLATARGEDIPTSKIPLVGRLVGNAASQQSEGNNFHANVNKLNELETEAKGMRKDGKAAEARALLSSHPESALIAQANVAERQIQRMRKEKRALIESGAPREQVRAKEEAITAAMARLNRAMERFSK